MPQAVRSVVRALVFASSLRYVSAAAGALGLLGMASVYWLTLSRSDELDQSHWDSFLQGSLTAASIGIAACTAVGVLLGGSMIVELYAQRLDLAIIVSDDEDEVDESARRHPRADVILFVHGALSSTVDVQRRRHGAEELLDGDDDGGQ